jgi:hypothetical protein
MNLILRSTLFFSALFLLEIGLQAQDVKRIDIASFNEVYIGGSFKVEITDDNNKQIVLSGDQQAIDEIEVSLRNNKLQIEKKRNSWRRSGYKGGRVGVQIPAVQLKAVYLSGSGSLNGTINASEDLKLVVSGSGSFDARIQGAAYISSTISGSGDMDISGSCERLTLKISGSGSLNANTLAAKTAEVKIAGSGNARLQVSERLSASVVGSGNVIYSGNPSTVEKSIAGSGRIRASN